MVPGIKPAQMWVCDLVMSRSCTIRQIFAILELHYSKGYVTFLSPNKKVTKEVGFPGAELIAPAIKAAPVSPMSLS